MSAARILELSEWTGKAPYKWLRDAIAEEQALIQLHDAKAREVTEAVEHEKAVRLEQPRDIARLAREVATTGKGAVRLESDAIGEARNQLELRRLERAGTENAKRIVTQTIQDECHSETFRQKMLVPAWAIATGATDPDAKFTLAEIEAANITREKLAALVSSFVVQTAKFDGATKRELSELREQLEAREPELPSFESASHAVKKRHAESGLEKTRRAQEEAKKAERAANREYAQENAKVNVERALAGAK